MVCHCDGHEPVCVNDTSHLQDLTGLTGFDRIAGVNVIGTKTAVLLVIIGTLYGHCGNVCGFCPHLCFFKLCGSHHRFKVSQPDHFIERNGSPREIKEGSKT